MISNYVLPLEQKRKAIEIEDTEQWIDQHVRQSQYMMQIIKCNRGSCCLPFKSNYKEFFQNRFLTAPIPLYQSTEGIARGDGGYYYSMFTSLHLNRILKPTCYNQYCPSVQIKDKNGKMKLEKRTYDECSLYYLLIEAMVAHKRFCKGRGNLDCDDEQSIEEKEGKMWISNDDANGDNDFEQIGIFSTKSTNSLALSKKKKKFLTAITDTHEW